METQHGFSTLTISHLQPDSLAEHVGRTSLLFFSQTNIQKVWTKEKIRALLIMLWERGGAVKWSNLSFSSMEAQSSLSAAQILLISMCMKRSTALCAYCLRAHAATWVWGKKIGLKSWTFMHSLTTHALVAAGLPACLCFFVLCCTSR